MSFSSKQSPSRHLKPSSRFPAPRDWPLWLALGALRLLCLLPVPWLARFGAALGGIFGHLAGRRRRVVATNLHLCFPKLDEAARRRLVDAHFRALGAGVLETAAAWLAPDGKFASIGEVIGLENLHAAQAQGQGVLLLTGHFTTLEIGARCLCVAGVRFHAMWREPENPLLRGWMREWRERHSGLPPLPKEDLRGLVRALRRGHAIWYGPDQTLETANAVFVPFFDVPALTLTATSRLAQMGRARVVPFFPERANGRYRVRILPALEDFPSGDDTADARRVNALLEDAIRRCPEQYLWVHRKFKYRPPGEPNLY